jgi:hypothetical protein
MNGGGSCLFTSAAEHPVLKVGCISLIFCIGELYAACTLAAIQRQDAMHMPCFIYHTIGTNKDGACAWDPDCS